MGLEGLRLGKCFRQHLARFGGFGDQCHQADLAFAHLVERVTRVPNYIVDLQEAVVQAADLRDPDVNISKFLRRVP
ncbi:hypothetical protein D9M69_649690 [compost metagenome]